MLHNQWLIQLSTTRAAGDRVGPRGQATRELLDQVTCFDASRCLLDVPARKLNYRFAVADWLWMMFGRSDVASITQYNSVLAQFSDDGMFFTGAYGPHVLGQKHRVLSKLRHDSDTRQAVIMVARPQRDTKDEPCTLTFQFLQRPRGTLNLLVSMRSNDLWLGLPYDAFNFAQLLNCVAGDLKLQRGWVSVRAGSSHLYERDLDKVAAMFAAGNLTSTTLAVPALPGFPPHWLEDVLVHRHDAVNGKRLALRWDADDPWDRYARALLADTSQAARAILAGVS